jgi:hypothetical protein
VVIDHLLDERQADPVRDASVDLASTITGFNTQPQSSKPTKRCTVISPVSNAKAAFAIWQQQGWGAWSYCSRSVGHR